MRIAKFALLMFMLTLLLYFLVFLCAWTLCQGFTKVTTKKIFTHSQTYQRIVDGSYCQRLSGKLEFERFSCFHFFFLLLISIFIFICLCKFSAKMFTFSATSSISIKATSSCRQSTTMLCDETWAKTTLPPVAKLFSSGTWGARKWKMLRKCILC